MAATRRSALWSRRRKASGAAEALPQPPSGQSPTLVAWRPKGGRRIWAGKDWLCVASALGNKWVRTDDLVRDQVGHRRPHLHAGPGRPQADRQAERPQGEPGAASRGRRRRPAVGGAGLVLAELLREQLGLDETGD